MHITTPAPSGKMQEYKIEEEIDDSLARHLLELLREAREPERDRGVFGAAHDGVLPPVRHFFVDPQRGRGPGAGVPVDGDPLEHCVPSAVSMLSCPQG